MLGSSGGHRPRSYGAVLERLRSQLTAEAPREQRMQMVVDALWERLRDENVSWLGFYLVAPQRDSLVLGPCRNKPACSPIGLHGVCGQSFLSKRPMIVDDVLSLGAGYIACDPRDRSEAVVPLFDQEGAVWGVLDLDSHDVGSFDEADVQGLQSVLHVAFGRAQA